MNSKRLLCFLLGAALILQTPATAYAAETLTYEQYRGGSGYSSTIKEQDYAVIEISTEEDLRRLAENCVRGKYLPLEVRIRSAVSSV